MMIVARSILSLFALINVAAATESTGIDAAEETQQTSFAVDERKLQFGRDDLCRCQAEWEVYYRSRNLDKSSIADDEGQEEERPDHRSLQVYDPDDIFFDDVLRLFVDEGVYVLDCFDRRLLDTTNATNTSSQVHQDERGLWFTPPGNIFRMGRAQGIGPMNTYPNYGGANYRANTYRGYNNNMGQPQGAGIMRTGPYYGGMEYLRWNNGDPSTNNYGANSWGQLQPGPPVRTNPYNGRANSYYYYPPPSTYTNLWPRAGIRQGKGYNIQGKGANFRHGKGGGIRKGTLGRNDDDSHWNSRPFPTPSPISIRPTPTPSFFNPSDTICNDFEFGYPVCCFDAPACRLNNNDDNRGGGGGINQPFGFECSTCPPDCDFLCDPIPEVFFCNDWRNIP